MNQQSLKPATGVCRWLANAENGNPRLSINGKVYEIEQIENGLVLVKPDGTKYLIDLTYGWGNARCDCPDARYRAARPGGCSHIKAVKAAWQAKPF